MYGVFKKECRRLTADSLKSDAAEWKALSEVYRILLNPAQASDKEIETQLGYVKVFGSAMYPLVMAVSARSSAGRGSWRRWSSCSRCSSARWWSARAATTLPRSCAAD